MPQGKANGPDFIFKNSVNGKIIGIELSSPIKNLFFNPKFDDMNKALFKIMSNQNYLEFTKSIISFVEQIKIIIDDKIIKSKGYKKTDELHLNITVNEFSGLNPYHSNIE